MALPHNLDVRLTDRQLFHPYPLATVLWKIMPMPTHNPFPFPSLIFFLALSGILPMCGPPIDGLCFLLESMFRNILPKGLYTTSWLDRVVLRLLISVIIFAPNTYLRLRIVVVVISVRSMAIYICPYQATNI